MDFDYEEIKDKIPLEQSNINAASEALADTITDDGGGADE